MITSFMTVASVFLVAGGLVRLARKNVGERMIDLLTSSEIPFAAGLGIAFPFVEHLFRGKSNVDLVCYNKCVNSIRRFSIFLITIGSLLFPGVSRGGLVSSIIVQPDVTLFKVQYSGIGNIPVGSTANIAIDINGTTSSNVQASVSPVSTTTGMLPSGPVLVDTVAVTYSVPLAFLNTYGSISFDGESPQTSGMPIYAAQANTPGWAQFDGGAGYGAVEYNTLTMPSVSGFTLSYYYAYANPAPSSSSLVFGSAAQGSGTQSMGFSIMNSAVGGPQAGLDLTSISSSGDTGVLSTNLASFSDLLPGQSNNFNAYFDTSAAPGSYSASYTLDFDNYELPGVPIGSMTITLSGDVTSMSNPPPLPPSVPEPNSLILSGLGTISGLGYWWGRRRKFAAA